MANDLQPANVAREVPKLAIWHLLLWMIGVAIMGAWHQLWRQYGQPQPFEWKQLRWGLSLAVSGLSIAGLWLAVRCLIRGERYFPVAAGHWLLLIGGFMTVIDCGATLLDYDF